MPDLAAVNRAQSIPEMSAVMRSTLVQQTQVTEIVAVGSAEPVGAASAELTVAAAVVAAAVGDGAAAAQTALVVVVVVVVYQTQGCAMLHRPCFAQIVAVEDGSASRHRSHNPLRIHRQSQQEVGTSHQTKE